MRPPVGKDWQDFLKNWYNAQGFGVKTSYGYHEGDDWNLKTGGDSDLGQPVYAIADGEVTSVHNHTTKPTYGNHIHIKHDGQWGTVYSHYAHLNSVSVKTGDRVKEGQQIGTLGKSGTNFAHLHFSIKKQPTGIDGIAKSLTDLQKWTNPTDFINKWRGDMSNELDACMKDRQKFWDERDETWRALGADSLEGAKSAIAGLKSRITTLGNDLGKAQAEVKNREEQVGRLRAELLGAADREELLGTQLQNKQAELEEMARTKGELQNELGMARERIATLEAEKGNGEYTLTIGELIKMILSQKITIRRKS